MNQSAEAHLHRLIEEDHLPEGMLRRAEHFLMMGDLKQLLELPIAPHDMIEAGKVLLGAPSIRQHAEGIGQSAGRNADAVYPTLSESLRSRLLALIREDGEYTDAALFLLSHDLRARACNEAVVHVEEGRAAG